MTAISMIPPSHEGGGFQMEKWGSIPSTMLLPAKSRLVMDTVS